LFAPRSATGARPSSAAGPAAASTHLLVFSIDDVTRGAARVRYLLVDFSDPLRHWRNRLNQDNIQAISFNHINVHD
jgi:hypothetical protein